MSKHKRAKVLVFCDWFVPGYKAGGPIRSVYNIVEGLKDKVDFWVVTRDTDLGEPDPYSDIQSDVWLEKDGYHVCYLSAQNRGIKSISGLIRRSNCDVIYLNSLFSTQFALFPLLLVHFFYKSTRVVLAPRGMLGAGALNIKSGKKKIFLKLTKEIGFYRDIVWHASTSVEKGQIQSVFGDKSEIKVARNMPSPLPENICPTSKQPDELRLIFLARISIVKNLHLALEYLSNSLVSTGGDMKVVFDIYGPLEEPEYWQKCEKIISNLPSYVHVSYKGTLPYPEVSDTLQQYHFLYLPTSTENYGNAIVESLIHGVPVIISDQTPWNNLSEYKAGWDIPISEKQRYQEVFYFCCEMDSGEYEKWTKGARKYAEKFIVTDEVRNENLGLFME